METNCLLSVSHANSWSKINITRSWPSSVAGKSSVASAAVEAERRKTDLDARRDFEARKQEESRWSFKEVRKLGDLILDCFDVDKRAKDEEKEAQRRLTRTKLLIVFVASIDSSSSSGLISSSLSAPDELGKKRSRKPQINVLCRESHENYNRKLFLLNSSEPQRVFE